MDHTEAKTVDRKGQIKWNTANVTKSNQTEAFIDVGPKYSKFTESVRHLAPSGLQCKLFCGGKGCKYESGTRWNNDDMAINGLFSHWVTDSILAMARPNTRNIEMFNMMQRFHEDDYGVRSLHSILDMVKVMDFAIQEGKVAVHCHAGLGRTGVLIACYLIYSKKMDSNQAIHFVRSKRRGAIQTRGQIECVHQFYSFIKNLWIIFPACEEKPRYLDLSKSLIRQSHLLHGLEAKRLRFIPKIIDGVYESFKNYIDEAIAEKKNNKKSRQSKKKASTSSSESQEEEDNPIASAKHLRRRDTPVMINGLDKTGEYYNKKKIKSSLNAFHEGEEEIEVEEEKEEEEEEKPKPNSKSKAHNAIPEDIEDDDVYQSMKKTQSDIDIINATKNTSSQIANNKLPGGASPLLNRRIIQKPSTKMNSSYQISTILESALTAKATTSMASVAGQWNRKLQPLNHAKVGQHTIGYTPLFLRSKSLEEEKDKKTDEENSCQEDREKRSVTVHNSILSMNKRKDIADVLTAHSIQSGSDLQSRSDLLQHEMNCKCNPWQLLNEQSMAVQVQLMWSWLRQLSKPVIGPSDCEKLIKDIDSPKKALYTLNKEQISTIMVFINIIHLLLPIHEDLLVCILECIGGAITFDNELTTYGLQGRTKLNFKDCFRLGKDILSTQNLPNYDKLKFTHTVSIREYTICEYLYSLFREEYLDK
ncbi:uncharacterized protein TRIADDRAFT_56940 [Trichoplax adhaerens]|uniref:Tyrosine specific protein phosphatases domain-containing protein n=1 Tax=Trichoplax adhaerens TaxID=10228 RepID=B3RWZ6_TRIAD|nr:hypothetical protein TRIADDRAFT_56940 [Trichoplax adhaerens]EDV25221.1 hypothetical protein TRIADDRAFT_56940 [Trichoplax adhaerens]|eukprot:XP_002113111.1 hypothetical protein TRIADDRAFT_56940 [Trichoplax adhaerens]